MKSKVFITCGLGFGDEGKGAITDFLASVHKIKSVVRYNGGGQAGHNVVTPKGVWHCFSQFGAHSFCASAETFLSREMLVDPTTMMVEEVALRAKGHSDQFRMVAIDARATVVTPGHKMIGRMKEVARGGSRFGSCGMGIGEAIRGRAGLSLVVGDLRDSDLSAKLKKLMDGKFDEASDLIELHRDIPELVGIRDYFLEKYPDSGALVDMYKYFVARSGVRVKDRPTYLYDCLRRGEGIIFEGAQGALLDRDWGFKPHVTQSKTTFHNAMELLSDGDGDFEARADIRKIGIMRAYSHRHGAGPFVTECGWFSPRWADQYNRENPWQGRFRVGLLDLPALRYGMQINDGVDEIALTSLDAYSGMPEIPVCVSYQYKGDLNLLDSCAIWQKTGKDRATIIALKKPEKDCACASTKVLLNCLPGTVIRLPSWSVDISSAKCRKDLPPEAGKFIDFLEGPSGLGCPIRIISVGPRRDQKFFV